MPDDPLAAAALEVLPSGPVDARLPAPPSKSVTNRALACAALASGTSTIRDPLASDDAEAMRAAVEQLGARVSDVPGGWRVVGTGGRLRSPAAPVDTRLSGTTMRFVSAMATLTPAGATVVGQPALVRRPVRSLVAALDRLGAKFDGDRGALPPVRALGGGLDGGDVTVDASASSQFVSAVLLVAPYARAPVTVRASGLGAAGYVELTVALQRAFGASIASLGGAAWRVEPGGYAARELAVEYDASAASHLWALAVATGGRVTVANAAAGSLQPDAGIPALLERMGASVRRAGDAVTVTGTWPPKPLDADLAAMPDQVTTVAALAALAPGTSRLRGVALARGHESDRLAALATELRKLGATVAELPDGLEVTGGSPRPARLATHGDHRLAMSLAAVATRVPGVVIEDPGCVAKTYPGFWHDLAAAGIRWRTHA